MGKKFDAVIAEQGGAEGPPLTTQKISPATLDALFETNSVKTPTGDEVDVTHVLAGLDTATAGVTFKAGAAEALYDISWKGGVTWTGDLASWIRWRWVSAAGQRAPDTGPATEAGPPEETGGMSPTERWPWLVTRLAASSTSKDDLLGDMDAEVMADEDVQPSTFEHVRPEGRPIRSASEHRHGAGGAGVVHPRALLRDRAEEREVARVPAALPELRAQGGPADPALGERRRDADLRGRDRDLQGGPQHG